MIMIKYPLYAVLSLLVVFASCKSHKKHLRDKSNSDTLSVAMPIINQSAEVNNPYYNTNFQLNLFQDSVTFYGFNSTNKWELKIVNNQTLLFTHDGETIEFKHEKLFQTQDASIVKYYSTKLVDSLSNKAGKNSITITVSEEKYLDLSSSIYVPFSLRIELQNSQRSVVYSGGGFYLAEPTIHDIWVLDSINTEKIEVKKFPQGLPTLEFKLEGGSLSGFSGCNYLNTDFYKVRNEIQFGDMALTMKSCMDVTGESDFITLLNKKRYSYTLKNGQLILVHRDKSKLAFRKVD